MHNIKSSDEFRLLLKMLRSSMSESFDKLRKEHPEVATLVAASASFDPGSGSFSFKVEGSLTGGKTKEAANYDMLREYQFTDLPELGFTFNSARDGQKHTVVGANRGAKVMTRRTDGRTFLWPAASIIQHKVRTARENGLQAGMTNTVRQSDTRYQR